MRASGYVLGYVLEDFSSDKRAIVAYTGLQRRPVLLDELRLPGVSA
jgi:hypothetical protein